MPESKVNFIAVSIKWATESWEDYFGPLTAVRRGVNGQVGAAIDDRETPGYISGLPSHNLAA
jgi:hypothetical protein